MLLLLRLLLFAAVVPAIGKKDRQTGSSLVVLRALSLTLSLCLARSLSYYALATLPLTLLLLSLSLISLPFWLARLTLDLPLFPFPSSTFSPSPLLTFLFLPFFLFSPKKLNPLSLPPLLITGTCFFIHKSAFLFFWVGGQSFFAPFPLLFFSVTETLPQLLLLSSFPGGTTAHTITGRLFLPVALCPPSLSRKPPPPLVFCLFFSFYFLFWFLSIPPSS